MLSVGMEVHAELLTKTKMFCRCPNEFGGEPNTRVCPVCLGLPGSLPVINRPAVEHVLRTALALNCRIAMRSVFHRKNYFYPDLPKAYQISQYGETNPLGHSGYMDFFTEDGGERRVRIRRVHLEEDTGKLMHLPGRKSGVDFNRAGVPLMEIVTDYPPDIHSPQEALDYSYQLRLLLIYLGACDGKMEEGSLRCEPNVSIAPEGHQELGTKTELKNLSSFRAVQSGIRHEAERMRHALERGDTLKQETRGWDEENEKSYVMRVKEFEDDYRYFPDPDLPPMVFSEEYIEGLRAALPELPTAKRKRFMEDLGLSDYDARLLLAGPAWARFFEEAVAQGGDPKQVCNWMNGDFSHLLNEAGRTAEASKVTPAHIADLTGLIASGKISGRIGKEVFEHVFQTGRMPSDVVKEEGKEQITDAGSIREVVSEVLSQNPEAVGKYREGKKGVHGFLVGQVMRKTEGMANPEMVNRLVTEELER